MWDGMFITTLTTHRCRFYWLKFGTVTNNKLQTSSKDFQCKKKKSLYDYPI